MTETKERFNDRSYVNWQKACQMLLVAKPEVDKLVKNKVKDLHKHLRQVGSNECRTNECEKIIKYTNDEDDVTYRLVTDCDSCQKWVDEIAKLHTNKKNISWTNSKLNKWRGNAFEVAKVYSNKMPKDRSKVASAESLDLSHVLNILTQCKFFHRSENERGFLTQEMLESVKDVLRVRNLLFHSSKQTLDNETLKQYKKYILDMLKALRIYGPNMEEGLDDLIELNPMYIDNQTYEDFRKMEAKVIAALIDCDKVRVEEQETDPEKEEEQMHENLKQVLKMLESPENEDLKAAVSVMRDIPPQEGAGGQSDILFMRHLYWQALGRVLLDLQETIRQNAPKSENTEIALNKLEKIKLDLYNNQSIEDTKKEDLDRIYNQEIQSAVVCLDQKLRCDMWLKYKYVNDILLGENPRQHFHMAYKIGQSKELVEDTLFIPQSQLLARFFLHIQKCMEERTEENIQVLQRQKQGIHWLIRWLSKHPDLQQNTDKRIQEATRFSCKYDSASGTLKPTSSIYDIQEMWKTFCQKHKAELEKSETVEERSK